MPLAMTTKRATRKRVPWPGLFYWLSGPVGITVDAPCTMRAHVALSPAGDCVPHLPWDLAVLRYHDRGRPVKQSRLTPVTRVNASSPAPKGGGVYGVSS